MENSILEFIEENIFVPETPEGAAAHWTNPSLLLKAEEQILKWLDCPSSETIMLCDDSLFIDIDEDLAWIKLGWLSELFHDRGSKKGKLRDIKITDAHVVNPGTEMPLILFRWNECPLALLSCTSKGQTISWLHMRVEDFKKVSGI